MSEQIIERDEQQKHEIKETQWTLKHHYASKSIS